MGEFYYITENEVKSKNFNEGNQNIILKIDDQLNHQIMVGKGIADIYEVIFSKLFKGWQYRVMDFIEYHLSHQYNILCIIDKEELNLIKVIYKNSSYIDNQLRDYEPKFLVHSTLPESLPLINDCGCLKSWNQLKKDNRIKEEFPIGKLLGDSEELSDYVMLGNGISCEIVVSSKQKNKIEMDIDSSYIPGGRYYFDAKKIAQDGLLVRDGMHYKVKDQLPLEKYLICLITPSDVNLSNQQLTPRVFTKLSDDLFDLKYKGK